MSNSLWSFIETHTPLLYLTQPVWRDEAFSVLMALNPPIEIVKIATNDFGFPLFYLILHYWMMLFGRSEIAIRLLPFIFHLATIYMVYKLAGYLAKNGRFFPQESASRWRSIVDFRFLTAAFTAINPMLLYYAFEARTYSLLAFLSVTSMYAFVASERKLWIVASTLGLYAHYYFVLVVLAQVIYILIAKFQYLNRILKTKNQKQKSKKIKSFYVFKYAFLMFNFLFFVFQAIRDLFKKNIYLFLPFIFFLPWTPILFRQIMASLDTWRHPADKDLWLSALGNLFTGYSGTPVTFARSARFISFTIFLVSLTTFIRSGKNSLLMFLWMIVPPFIILGISSLLPLWVNRYLIFVAVAEILLIMLFIYSLPQKLRVPVYLTVFGLTLMFNIWFARYQKKTDFRTPLATVKSELAPTDLIAATDALIFFETRYYLLDMPNQVKLYNPQRKHIPNYVGTAIIEQEDIITELPGDRDVYLVNMDTSITKFLISN